MKRYIVVLAPAFAGLAFGTGLGALVVKPAQAQSAPASEPASKPQMPAIPGEETVDVYKPGDDNAGAAPFTGPEMIKAFHGTEGIDRIVDDLVERIKIDKRTTEAFHASDFVRLRRTLKEQFCYILGGDSKYTGRDMVSVHKDHGVKTGEFNALVEDLQDAMNAEGVAFTAQNRFLAKLAPMKRVVVVR
jgi:hemoglobin